MNDNYWYPRDPQRYLTDTAWCDAATEVAHNRLIDTYYALGKPIKDDQSRISLIGKIQPQDYQRVRGNLLELGWFVEAGVWRHKRIEQTMAETEENRQAQIKRTAAATAARNAQRNAQRNGVPTTTTTTTIDTTTAKAIEHTHCADANIPTLAEVKTAASMDAILEASAKSFFDHHENNSLWINQHGRLINWRSKLKSWSERDRQPRAGKDAPRASQGPKLSDVMSYAKEKWGDDLRCGNWASSFYAFWAGKKWNHKDGKTIDWKIKLTEQVAKWRAE